MLLCIVSRVKIIPGQLTLLLVPGELTKHSEVIMIEIGQDHD